MCSGGVSSILLLPLVQDVQQNLMKSRAANIEN